MRFNREGLFRDFAKIADITTAPVEVTPTKPVPPSLFSDPAPTTVTPKPIIAPTVAPTANPKPATPQPFADPAPQTSPKVLEAPVYTPALAPIVEEITDINADTTAPVVDINKVIETNKYGGALKYSQLSDEDKAVVDARRAASVPEPVDESLLDPDFNIVDWHSGVLSADDFQTNLQREIDYAKNNFDPNRGELSGTTAEGWARDQLIGLPFLEFISAHNIEQSRATATTFEVDYPYDYDGDNLYMKVPETGGNTDMYQGFSNEDKEQYRDLQDRGYFIDISEGQAGVGEYTMMWFEDPPEESTWSGFLNNPMTNVIAAFVPFGTAALTALKATSGETLHASDWANLVSGGLEASGVITPTTVDVGGVEVAGTGLMGTTYEQTQAIITAAGGGDFTGVVSTMVGGDVLGALGFDEDTIQGWADASGLTLDGMSEGVAGILSGVATGESLGEAILSSGVQVLIDDYENEGDLSGALLDGVGSLGEMLEGWGTALEDSVLAPFLDTVGDLADSLPIEEMIDGFSDIAGTLTDVVANGLDEVVSGVISTVGAILPEGDAYIVNAFDDLASTTGETIESLLDSAGLTVADMAEASPSELDAMYNTVNELFGNVGDIFSGGDDEGLSEDDLADLRDQASSDLVDLSTATGESIDDLISGAGTSLESLADATGQTIEEMLDASGTDLQDLADTTGQSIEDLVSGAGTNLQDLADATGSTIDELMGQTGTALSDLVNETDEVLSDVVTETGTYIDNLVGTAASDLNNLANTSATILETLSSDTGASLEDLIAGTGATLADLASATGQSVEELLGGAESGLADLADATGQTIEELLDASGTNLEDLSTATGESIADLTSGAAGNLDDLATATGESIEDLVGQAGANLDDLADATGQTLDELLGGTGDALGDMLGSVGGQFGILIDDTRDSVNATTNRLQQAEATRTSDELFEFIGDIEDTQKMVDFDDNPFKPNYNGLF